MGYATGSLSIEGETEGNTQLGETSNSEGSQIVFGVCQLLSPLHFQICGDSSPTSVPDQEGCGDAMGSSSAVGIPTIEGCPVQCADASLPGSYTTIHGGNGCIGDSNRGCFDAGPGRQSTPHCIYESSSKAYRTVVFGL